MKWFSILKLSFRILIVHHIWNAQLPLILATVLRLSVWYFWIYNFIRIRIEQSECGLITVFLLFQLKIESPHCIRETRTHCSKWKVISRMKFQKQIGIFSLIFFFFNYETSCDWCAREIISEMYFPILYLEHRITISSAIIQMEFNVFQNVKYAASNIYHQIDFYNCFSFVLMFWKSNKCNRHIRWIIFFPRTELIIVNVIQCG